MKLATSIFSFQNHDNTTLINSNPLVFNVLLLILFYGVFVLVGKKTKTKGVFDSKFTNMIKGFCILNIIVGHLAYYGLHRDGSILIFPVVGGLMVTIFLFLSGYGLTESAKV